MKGAERLPEIEVLAAAGLTNPEIGKRLGLSKSQVWKLRNPEAARRSAAKTNARRAAAKRAWERDPANRAPCVSCGGPTGNTSRRSPNPRCQKCRDADIAAFRAAVIEGYRVGQTAWQIAERTARPLSTVRSEAVRLRRKGIEVPYAPTGTPSHRLRQAAAGRAA